MYRQQPAPLQSLVESCTQTSDPAAFAPVDAYGQATALQEPEQITNEGLTFGACLRSSLGCPTKQGFDFRFYK